MPGQVNRTQGIQPGMNELFSCGVVFCFVFEEKIDSLSDLEKVTSSLHFGP